MVASYYRFDVEIPPELPGRIAISKRKIAGGVIRGRDLVAQLKIAKFFFFPGVFAVDSRENFPLTIWETSTSKLFSCKSVSYTYQFQLLKFKACSPTVTRYSSYSTAF